MANPNSSKWDAIRTAAANAAHGTNARYSAGCRCPNCRIGRSEYERGRLHKNTGNGRTVSTESARQHLLKLQKLGMGYLRVADASGVNHNICWGILKGDRERARHGTVERILGVDLSCAADGNRIPAGEAWGLLNGLIRRGFSKTQLAFWLGYRGRTPSLQIPRDYITAGNALRVKRLVALLDAGKVERGKPCLPPVKPRGRRPKKDSTAEHGTYARYSFGCRCGPCRAAKNKYSSDWKRQHASGTAKRKGS